MTKNLRNSSSSSHQALKKKIGFWTLYKKFKFEVIKHFLITTVWTILLSFVLTTVSNFSESKLTNGNFSALLPEKLRGLFPNLTLKQFAVWGLVLICLFAFTSYFASLWEEELRIKGGHYAKNILLDKFRQLPLEEKQIRQKEINTLVELDSGEIGHYWEHIPNHIYHSVLTIILLIWMKWGDFSQMRAKEAFFSFSWLLLINIVSYFFTKLILRNDKRYKKELTKEWTVQQKETSQAILIDSMGLTSHYRNKQRKMSKKNENLLFSFNNTKSLNKTIPHRWLVEIFPYFLLLISGVFETAQKNLLGMWFIYDNFGKIFECFWDYSDYATSQERINSFLFLPEKNDNLTQSKLPLNAFITSIRMENVSFRYQGKTEWVLKNYTRTFTPAKINHLTGKNGTGKSTILYLLLGMITPNHGQIIIKDREGNTYNLQQDINLQHWREHNVAYLCHDTLLEEGSTGQRQLININQTFKQKKGAQIWLFDEANNALDKDNQEQFQERIKELAKNKIVIYIKH